MTQYELKLTKSTFDPFWVRTYMNRHVDSIVNDDNSVSVGKEHLVFLNEILPVGTKVKVSIGNKMFCCSIQDYESQLASAKSLLETKRLADEKQRELVLANAKKFYSSITIPFQFDVGIKDVLSGLSEKSNGSGMNKSTVFHVRVLEDLSDKNLIRKSGDFLCKANSGSNGKAWNNQHSVKLDDETFQIVTCKQCLKYLKRYSNS